METYVSKPFSLIPQNFHSSPKFRAHQFRFSPTPLTNLSLSISSSTLRMAQCSQNNSAVPQKQVVVQNKHGEKLLGLLDDTGSSEIVILCHGFRASKEKPPVSFLAEALKNEGISAFRFDFSGNGESEGTFQYGHYRREADDLRSVIEHFSGENRVISAILGHSKGGDVVLLYASKYHDIKTVINVSGRYDLKRGISERVGEDFVQKLKENGYIDVKDKKGNISYRVTEESMMDRLNTDMHSACLQIDKECRLFTIHGSEDEIIPVEDALEFDKIIPNHKLRIVEGADHGYTSHQNELASIVVELVKSTLKP